MSVCLRFNFSEDTSNLDYDGMRHNLEEFTFIYHSISSHSSLTNRFCTIVFTTTTSKIWVRNYQILEESASTAKEANSQKKLTGHAHSTSLIEIGPRFVLNPIRIFRGSFGGQTLYVNDDFVNPNLVRSMEKKEKGEKYVRRKGAERKRKSRDESIVVPKDPLADVFH